MPGTLKWQADASTSLLTTELNALGNAAGSVLGPQYNNQNLLNFWGDFELVVTFGVAATDASTVDLYIIPAMDGTNYSNGGVGVQPVNFYRGSWSLTATTVFRLAIHGVMLPPVPFKIFVVNNSGQPFPATGSVVNMVGYREQYT